MIWYFLKYCSTKAAYFQQKSKKVYCIILAICDQILISKLQLESRKRMISRCFWIRFVNIAIVWSMSVIPITRLWPLNNGNGNLNYNNRVATQCNMGTKYRKKFTCEAQQCSTLWEWGVYFTIIWLSEDTLSANKVVVWSMSCNIFDLITEMTGRDDTPGCIDRVQITSIISILENLIALN